MAKQLPWGTTIDVVRGWIDAAKSATGATTAGAERAVAEEYGFATWRQLEAYVTHPADLADFLLLGCLAYFTTDRPENRERARAMLEQDPALGARDIHTAACVGDVAAVADFLAQDASLVNRRGGYFDWEPLLYACYSRLEVPGRSTLEVARLLLDWGADPNSHYMWGGQYRFTALTGAFGEGEMGPVNQPPHGRCAELAKLLLDAGADPNDGQALYNTMFTPGHDCLAMLLEYGLGPQHRCNWLFEKNGIYVDNPDQTLGYQLNWAVRNHHVERAKRLIDNGADLAVRTGEGKTLYEAAWRAGHPDLVRYLAERGAETVEIDSETRLVAACMAGDAETAKAMVDATPRLIRRVQKKNPDLVVDAAGSNRLDAVGLMADLGFNLDRVDAVAPLHQAAFQGHREMVELLLRKGADPNVKDKHHDATPQQWATTGGHPDIFP